MATDKLQVEINARDNASGVLRGVAGTAKTSFAGMAGAVKQYSGEIRAAGLAMTAMGAAVVAGAGKCIGLLRTQEVAQAKLTSAIKGSGQAIDQMGLEKLAAQLQKVTTFGDEATIEMMAILTTFNLTQRQIEELAPRIQNISAMMGTDLVSSAVAVGKAIQMGSASALQRYGIIIDEATMKSGDFNGMLKAIDANTGPAAEELAKGAGAAEQLKNTIGDLGESIGKALVPSLKAAKTVLTPAVELMGKLAETKAGSGLVALGTAAGAAMIPLGAIGMVLPSVVRGAQLLGGAMRVLAVRTGTARIAMEAYKAALIKTAAIGATAWGAILGPLAIGFAVGSAIGLKQREAFEERLAGMGQVRPGWEDYWAAEEGGAAQLAAPGMAAIAPEFAPAVAAPGLARTLSGPTAIIPEFAAAAAAPIAAAATHDIIATAVEEGVTQAIAAAPPARTVGGMTQVGAGAWMMEAGQLSPEQEQRVRLGRERYEGRLAGRAAWAEFQASLPQQTREDIFAVGGHPAAPSEPSWGRQRPVSMGSGRPVEGADMELVDHGEDGYEVVVRVQVPRNPPPGILDDNITDWMEDFQYPSQGM